MTARTILVDLRGCQFNGDRGIPAYAQSLALELTRSRPRHHWLLLRDDRWPPPNRAAELAAQASWCTAADLDRRSAPAIDVVLTGCFFLPHHGCDGDYLFPRSLRRRQPRRLGIVYDLVPLLFPDRYLTSDRARRQYHDALGTLRHSDHLFAISQATRRDTIRHAAVDPLRVTCIYGDIDHAKRDLTARPAADTADVPARHGLTAPYCVYVGGDDWRKNMETAVRAFARFWRRHAGTQLAVVCKLSAARIAALRQLAVDEGLPETAGVFTGFVAPEVLAQHYRDARVFVSVPMSDATSISLLEAMGHGCLPVLSNLPANLEWVLDGINGAIVEDLGRLGCALKTQLRQAGDNARLASAAALNRQLVEAKGLYRQNMQRFAQIYRELC